VAAPPLYTNIDLDLQRFVAGIFGDSLIGGAVAMDPKTGRVLALYSAPTPDYNRFIGGVPRVLRLAAHRSRAARSTTRRCRGSIRRARPGSSRRPSIGLETAR
jgi:cell division protein FtsI/penicillin-binding protein 2